MFPLKFTCAVANDPFLNDLYKLYKATPVMPPSANDIDLLYLIAHKGKKTSPLGPLEDVLHASETPVNLNTITSEVMGATLRRTSNLNLNLGFQVLSGVFQGFNLDMQPLKGAVGHGKELSFAFTDVRRKRVFPTAVGSALMNHKINTEHVAIKDVINKRGLYLVTSILQSKNFQLTFEKQLNLDMDFDVAAHKVADAKLSVQSNKGKELVLGYEGEEYLTFAFSCVELMFDKDGRLSISTEVIWKRGDGDAAGMVAEMDDPEISFMNPDMPAILSWDKG